MNVSRNGIRRVLALAFALMLTLSVGISPAMAAEGASQNKFFNDYNTMAEAVAAAEKLNLELAEEGDVLLKNDGTLPLNGNERISVFGVKQDNLLGASTSSAFAGAESTSDGSISIAKSLQKAGFNVNPTLVNFYAADNSGIGSENLNFSGEAEASMEMYDDVAVIVFTREGGEGSDANTVTGETVGEDDDHAALYTNANGNTYKHILMLTDSEEKLVEYVKARFDKIIVLLNTSNVMEMGDLQNDPQVCAILWMGRPGMTGTDAVGEILSGKVNPSGRLVDVWPADLSADPTWYNFGSNKQTGTSTSMVTTTGASATGASGDKAGYFAVDYEEGIYLGYKYYETYYWEKYSTSASAGQQWYEENVVYPFGYGLSYTTFSMNISGGLYTDEALTQKLGSSVNASSFNTDASNPHAQIEKLYVPVVVENTGNVAGKQVVQVYVTAPYTKGGIEKSSVVLVGFAKTSNLQPGESETVVVSFNVQDMASWDYNDANNDGVKGDFELDAGTYYVRVMESSHYDRSVNVYDETDGYDHVTFTLNGTAHQKTDDFSGNSVGNLFSAENGVFDSKADGYAMYYNNIRTSDLMADGTSAMTILSRADFDGTFPKAPVTIIAADGTYSGDLVFKDEAYANWLYYDSFNVTEGDADQADDLWVKAFQEAGGIPADWTQNVDSGLTFADMAGVSADDPRWTTLMNQLSWEELVSLVENGGYSTAAVESIGKIKVVDADGPNNFSSSYPWCCECVISSTWNTNLANKQGRIMGCFGMFMNITGWYAPGMDTHRSAFSGRNNEYYSQDGIQGGYMAAAVVSGAESKGLICYVKHIALNDQETTRDGKVLFVWADEQTIRENYTKVFQMAMQEGGSSAAMAGYARLGGIPNASNYNFMTALLKGEWGWQGYMVTDGYIGWQEATELDMMVRAGCELQLYTSPYVEEVSGEWDATARDGKGSVVITVTGTPQAGVENPNAEASYISDIQYYYTRMCAQRVLYMTANSTNQQNGFANLTYNGKNFAVSQHVSLSNTSVAFEGNVLGNSSAVYTVTAGSLPAGVTLNASNGQLSGTPTEVGTFAFTVEATIDTYVVKSASYVITVDSAFAIADGSDPLDSAKVGRDFYAAITSSVFATSANGGTYDSVTYAAEGLPAGLTISEDGIISGTPTEAGTFKVIVQVTASKEVESGSSGGGEGSAGGGSDTADAPAEGESEGGESEGGESEGGESEGGEPAATETPTEAVADVPAEGESEGGESEGGETGESEGGESEGGEPAATEATEAPAEGESEGGESEGGETGESEGGETATEPAGDAGTTEGSAGGETDNGSGGGTTTTTESKVYEYEITIVVAEGATVAPSDEPQTTEPKATEPQATEPAPAAPADNGSDLSGVAIAMSVVAIGTSVAMPIINKKKEEK